MFWMNTKVMLSNILNDNVLCTNYYLFDVIKN